MLKIRRSISSPAKWVAMIFSVGLCIVGYSLLSELTTTQALPSLMDIGRAAIRVCMPQGFKQEIWLLEDCSATYYRILISMLWGCSIGLVLGLLMGCFEIIDALLYPILGCFLAYIPSSAIVAVLAILFSTSENLFTILLILSIAPQLACKIAIVIRNDVTIERVDKTYTLGASNVEVVYDFVLQQILPKIIDNIRLQVSYAFIAVIAAELMIGSVGFGYRLRLQSRNGNWDVVYVYLIFLAMSGFIIDMALIQFRKLSCNWFEKIK